MVRCSDLDVETHLYGPARGKQSCFQCLFQCLSLETRSEYSYMQHTNRSLNIRIPTRLNAYDPHAGLRHSATLRVGGGAIRRIASALTSASASCLASSFSAAISFTRRWIASIRIGPYLMASSRARCSACEASICCASRYSRLVSVIMEIRWYCIQPTTMAWCQPLVSTVLTRYTTPFPWTRLLSCRKGR